jgi:adenine-specific DNA-methyltransferase
MNEQPAFTWPNCDRLLVARGETDYEWVDEAPSAPMAVHRGQVGSGEVVGLVGCGDALDVIQAVSSDGRLLGQEVRLVYIDPPFGAGKRFGHYRDTLSSAAWLSMLRDRLAALKPFLSRDASIWLHLDETMSHRGRMILDDLFGEQAYVATVIWQKRVSVESRTAISVGHDPILVYAPAGQKHWKTVRNRIAGPVSLTNRDGDPRGPWRDAPFTCPGYRPGQQYTIVNPAGMSLTPPRGRSWFATEPVFRRLLAEDRIWWPKGGAGKPRLKNFNIDSEQVPGTIWTADEVGTNDDAKRQLSSLFPDAEVVFDTPKPERLLERIIHIGSGPGDLVVDLFGGSGTTAAVAHKMGRRWFTTERLVGTVNDVLVPRLTAVVNGVDIGGVQLSGWNGGRAFEVIQVEPRLGSAPHLRLDVEVAA